MFLPRKIRKMIALLRGQVSPVLVGIAVGLGFWFGFIPGFSGIHYVLLIALVLLNIPIGLFLLSGALGKALCLAIAPVVYNIGVFCQDYLGWLIGLLGKIPIIGLTDFETSAVSGALAAGLVLGVVFGYMAGLIILGFRKTWFKLENNSEKFAAWQSKKWVKFLDWLLISKRAKSAKDALEAKTVYIRKAGAILVVLVVVVFIAAGMALKNDMIKDKIAQTLSEKNGATVDVGSVNLSPLSGAFAVSGVEVADRQNPANNSVQVGDMAARIDMYSLSVGKLFLEEAKFSDILFGQKRTTPAEVTRPIEPEPAEEDLSKYDIGKWDMTKLDTYLENARKLKEWLAKIQKWIPEKDPEPQQADQPHKYLDYLKIKAQETPVVRFLAKHIEAENVGLEFNNFGKTKMVFSNLSDNPVLAKLPVGIDVTSETGQKINISWDPAKEDGVNGTFENIDLKQLQSSLKSDNGLVFKDGKASGSFQGKMTRSSMDILFTVKMADLQADSGSKGLFGMDQGTSRDLVSLLGDRDIQFRLFGSFTSPSFALDTEGLMTALKEKALEMGKQKALDEINKKIGGDLQEKLGDKVPEELKDAVKPEGIMKGLGDLLGGKKED